MLGMYAGAFSFVSGFSVVSSSPRPTTKSPAHPSDTQTPWASYPHVLPSMQGDAPADLARATPCDVSAGQCCRSPGFEEHLIVIVVGTAAGEAGEAVASWAVAGAATSQIAASNAPHVVLATCRAVILPTSFVLPLRKSLPVSNSRSLSFRLEQAHATPVLRPGTTAL